jgi:hypothetical protein
MELAQGDVQLAGFGISSVASKDSSTEVFYLWSLLQLEIVIMSL